MFFRLRKVLFLVFAISTSAIYWNMGSESTADRNLSHPQDHGNGLHKSPGRIGDPARVSSNTLTPFGSVDCRTPSGLLQNKKLCSPDVSEFDESDEDDDLPIITNLKLRIDSLNENNVADQMWQILTYFAICFQVASGRTDEAFYADASIDGCDSVKLAQLGLNIETKLASLPRDAHAENAIFMWLDSRRLLLRTEIKNADIARLNQMSVHKNPALQDYEWSALRLKAFIEGMSHRNPSHQTTLDLLVFEQEVQRQEDFTDPETAALNSMQ